ncbi:MAG: hypothetical protein ACTII7_05020 [Galactobacter sp.]
MTGAAFASVMVLLTGCTGGSSSAPEGPTSASPSSSVSVDTRVTDQPDVSEAFGPALWQVDERKDGTLVGVLSNGSLVLDSRGDITAVDKAGSQVWTTATDSEPTRHEDGSVTVEIHAGASLLGDGQVAASSSSVRTSGGEAGTSAGMRVVLLNTSDGSVVKEVELTGCASTPPRQFSGGLAFSGVCEDGKTATHSVLITPEGAVQTIPEGTYAVVDSTPISSESRGSRTIEEPAWLSTALRDEGSLDLRADTKVFTDGRGVAVVQGLPMSKGPGYRVANVVVDFASQSAWKAPECFIATSPGPFPRSADGSKVGLYALVVDRTKESAMCLEKNPSMVTATALSDDGTVYGKSIAANKELLIVGPDGERTLQDWPDVEPVATGGGLVFNASAAIPGARIITAHRPQ